LVDGEDGAYGVVFPDLPGCVAMGHTVDEALLNAEDSLHDYMLDAEQDGEALPDPNPFQTVKTPGGNRLVSIPLIRPVGVACGGHDRIGP
jgi:predicted RNase H-like HicB family nuclease